MKKTWLVMSLVVVGCAQSSKAVLPSQTGPAPEPVLTLLWVGQGEAERLVNGAWQRAPSFDYEFSVEQRRFADHWESVKQLRRRNPAYDGSAGPWEQTYFFRVDYQAGADGVASTVKSTLGDGRGKTDHEFREASFELSPDISPMAPFNTYRITQHYRYEQGGLEETVELFKREGGVDHAWVRNHEKATLFAPHSYPAAPTTL